MTAPIDYVFTFVLPKADKEQFAKLCQHFHSHRAATLSKDKAVDIYLTTDDADGIRQGIAKELAQIDVTADYCLQTVEGRKKTLLICDMDSTLIGQECIDELADYAGVKDRVSQITERAMRGEIGFDGALRERVSLLKGLPLTVIEDCYKDRIHLNDGARILARTMASHGAETVIVSGGFTVFTSRVAKAAGFSHHHANVLLESGDTLSGNVQEPILGRDAKKSRLMEYSAPLGGPNTAIAIGDGANDLAMIQSAGLGIAFYAKPAVTAAAHCGIDHTDLTTALYFQGYRESEFVKD